jgi:YHS domain-containing protein
MKKLVLILFVLVSISCFSQNETTRITHFNLENKVAIHGYDPVAYFKQNKAIKGKNDITASYMGVIYKFSSVTNKEVFIKNPSAYEPQFGGWCAFAMGDSGDKVDVNPETFKIIDGKLYLFYNAFFNNTLKSWNNDQANLKVKAENNWKKIFR